jgi:hypothetical protein
LLAGGSISGLSISTCVRWSTNPWSPHPGLLRRLAPISPAENLSQGFATLRPYGVLVNGAEIRLTSPDDLARLAKPAPLINGNEHVGPRSGA